MNKLDKEEKRYSMTFSSWDKVAKQYEGKFMSLDIYQDSYRSFSAYLSTNAKVLDVGCGPGIITSYLKAHYPSFILSGIDISSKMIELAKSNVQEAHFSVLDIRNLHTINESFDGIICGFALPYLSKNDLEKFLIHSHQLLFSKGYLYISFVEGDYEKSGIISGSTGDEMYFYYHSVNYIVSLLKKSDFNIVHTEYVTYTSGREEQHTIIIAQKSTKGFWF